MASTRLNHHVVTPSIPERDQLLMECVRSVICQTAAVGGHHVGVDHDRRGPAVMRNELAIHVPDGAWVSFLDDDDLWHPQHARVIERYGQGADVVYTKARIDGRPGWDPQRNRFSADALRRANYIPLGGVAIKIDLFRQVGGFPTEDMRYEDHGLLLRLLDAGARFKCIPRFTWTYRFGDWDSRSKEIWRGER